MTLYPLAPAFAIDPNILPSNGVVTSGSANFDYTTPNQLHIQQNSDRAVIDWDSFDIGTDAMTQFHQNSSSSITVNRVTRSGADPPQILGTLTANGQVIVLDRNGILFGHDSIVDVGGIIASTVINNGIIRVKTGRVALASGNHATIDMYGDDLVEVVVSAPAQQALLENNGAIYAEGGTILMTAAAAQNVADGVINNTGIIDVSSVTEKGGKIILEGANTKVSGTLNASGKKGGGKIKRAQKTTVTETAKLTANTTGDDGNGGLIVVWSDDSTQFDDTIEAKGGSQSGDGGTVETSGKINLGVSGTVDASAANGKNGEWLLNPSDVTISASGGNNVPSGGGTVNPGSDSYQVSASSIQAALNSGNNVTITTTNGSGSQPGGMGLVGATLNAQGGSIIARTQDDANAFFMANSQLITNGNGNINITGIAGGPSRAAGVMMNNTSNLVQAENGTITITGTNTTPGIIGAGVYLDNTQVSTTGTTGGDIYSTGGGTINLTGTATSGGGTAYDFITQGTGTSNMGNSASNSTINFNTDRQYDE